jgi:sarcosine oxidase
MTTAPSVVSVDVVVVGAGVLGLAAARSLAKRGRRVVVCEQATVGHDGGGSKGSARIFRLGYDEPWYVRLALTAQTMWRQWEDEAETTLLTTTGQVTLGDDLEVLAQALAVGGAPFARMTPGEVADRYPVLSVSTPAIFEPSSGVIDVGRCLAALQRVPGVEVREHSRVTRCDDDGRRVRLTVESPGATLVLEAPVAVVCAGPWTGPLVAHVATNLHPWPTLEQVAYLTPVDVAVAELPVVVERRRPWFYGLPDFGRGLMKVSLHGAGPAMALDQLGQWESWDVPDQALMAELSESARRILPGLAPEPVDSERCLYDNTPDGDFVIDRVGNVIIGSGTSGHGFKFAPLLGEVLADLATEKSHSGELGSENDLDRFRVKRLRGGGGGPPVHR